MFFRQTCHVEQNYRGELCLPSDAELINRCKVCNVMCRRAYVGFTSKITEGNQLGYCKEPATVVRLGHLEKDQQIKQRK